MTIDELLEIAARHVKAAVDDPDTDCAMRYAATAQAAAQTAQSMIMHAQAQDIAASNERAELQELWRQ